MTEEPLPTVAMFGLNHVSTFLCNHYGGSVGVCRRNGGYHRRIDDPESIDPLSLFSSGVTTVVGSSKAPILQVPTG